MTNDSRARTSLRAGALLLVAAALCCNPAQPGPEAGQRSAGDDVVLRVGGGAVRLAEVQAQVDRLPPPARARLTSPEERRTFTDRVVKNEIFAAEARRLGYDRDPEVLLAAKKAMVQKLLKERLGPGPTAGEITEAMIEAYYRAHQDELGSPGETRVTQIVVESRERASAVLSEAEQAAREARRTPGDTTSADLKAFRGLVLRRSEDAEVASHGGDLTIVEGRRDGLDAALVEAALALREVGDLSSVIETPQGFHVLKLRQRVPSSHPSMAESRTRITHILTDASRDRKLDELAAKLAQTASVEVFEDRLAQVRFDATP